MSNPSLSDDLVPDWAGIALHLFKKDDPSTIRKCRNLADRHGMPVHRKGRYCWAFRSQLDRWARGGPEHGATKLTGARLDGAGTNGTQRLPSRTPGNEGLLYARHLRPSDPRHAGIIRVVGVQLRVRAGLHDGLVDKILTGASW